LATNVFYTSEFTFEQARVGGEVATTSPLAP